MKTNGRDTITNYQCRLRRVQDYIAAHLDEPLSLELLAAIAHFSPFHFHRIFSGMCGESLAGYIRRLRLQRAARGLLGRSSVIHLALEAGYDSHEAFTRAFKSHYGVTPSAWRKAGGQPASALCKTRAQKADAQSKGRDNMEVQIKQLHQQTVVFLRHTGPYHECAQTWRRLGQWAGANGVYGAGTKAIGVCYDDPEVTPPEKIHYDACLTIDKEVALTEGVESMRLPAGTYACYLHKGPYDQLLPAYRRLCGEWIPQAGHQIRNAPSLEVYLNCPDDVPPQELLTEIMIPLEA